MSTTPTTEELEASLGAQPSLTQLSSVQSSSTQLLSVDAQSSSIQLSSTLEPPAHKSNDVKI